VSAKFFIDTVGKLEVATGIMTAESTGSVPLNTWTHIAYVRSGTSLTFYINGIASGSATWDNRAADNLGDSCTIGQNYTGTEQFAGYIDDLRLTHAARWYGDFTPNTQEVVTSARSSYNTPLAAFDNGGLNLSGVVRDENGNGVARRVLTYSRNTGKLIADTYSNTDGTFLVNASETVFVVALDDDIGPPLNAIVEDRITPA
jgi:hypothetical protein